MTQDKICMLEQAINQVENGNLKEKIVFTNGCFDIVHLGHIDYLEKARKLGDKLVLGLNTDVSGKSFENAHSPCCK
jgi:cytidyltransferase-like protein